MDLPFAFAVSTMRLGNAVVVMQHLSSFMVWFLCFRRFLKSATPVSAWKDTGLRDNKFIEHLWENIRYEEVHVKAY